MLDIITTPEFIVNMLAGLILIITGLVLNKKEKPWGIYLSLLGVAAIIVQVIRWFVIM